ncbi:hypothetical protein J4Q44_G00189180, partial [Coregonus suidteri]
DTILQTRTHPVFSQFKLALKKQGFDICYLHKHTLHTFNVILTKTLLADSNRWKLTMAAATSSNTSTTTLQIKHSSIEHTRKRIDPRRRQAALSFLSNISLDGRPVQDDADNHFEEDSSIEERTRQSLVSAAERPLYAAGGGAGGATPTAAQALAIANQALIANARDSFGIDPAATAQACTDPEGDVFGPSIFSSPFSAVPAAIRGRLQTYTQGVVPAAFSRQTSQGFCLEGGQIANSVLELQRSRAAAWWESGQIQRGSLGWEEKGRTPRLSETLPGQTLLSLCFSPSSVLHSTSSPKGTILDTLFFFFPSLSFSLSLFLLPPRSPSSSLPPLSHGLQSCSQPGSPNTQISCQKILRDQRLELL